MSECVALNRTRVAARVALAGVLGLWLAGCSSDATRLTDPFSNPFASNDQAPAPSANVSSNASPQANANFAAVAHPSPVAVADLPAPAPTTTGAIARPTTTQPITGFGDGWRAAGGSPIIVADGDTLEFDFAPFRRADLGAASGQRLRRRLAGAFRRPADRAGL